MGVIRGRITKPSGSLKGLGMGSVLMPKRDAMSAIGNTVETPVRRSIKDWMGPARPSLAAVVASEVAVLVASAVAVVVSADEAVVASPEEAAVVASPPRRPKPRSPPDLSF